MNQQELADKVGLHSTAISQIDRGDRADIPRRDTVERLDTALSADGTLLEAAGYSVERDERSAAPVHSGYTTVAIPLNLTLEDVELVKALINQLSKARG